MTLDPDALRRSVPGRVVGNVRVDAMLSAVEIESDGARLLNAGATDLLGLAADARVRDALQAAVRRYGLSRTPRSKPLAELEEQLAAQLGAEAATVLEGAATALAALGQVGALVDARARWHVPGGVVVASPEDAVRALGASAGSPLVVGAVDPLTGELAAIHRFAEAAQRAAAPLVVLDPAGLGVLGPRGLGAAEALGLGTQLELHVLNLGQSVPGSGVVFAGRASMIGALRGLGQPPPLALLAATARALELASTEAQRRARVFDVAQQLVDGLRALDLDTGPCVTPWIPVWMGDEPLTEQWLRALAEQGVACRAFLARERSRLLVSMAATATDAQVAGVLSAFEKVARRLRPPALDAVWRGPVLLARPGSFALATPCAPRWRDVILPAALPPRPAVEPDSLTASLSARVFDAVETLTWRATNVRGGKLGLPSAEALKALFDRRRPR
jgi:7-keto-8-aminopelargonate synthetase-like enzyme